jgi:phage/plasmid-like protein (TIGR03299 family)
MAHEFETGFFVKDGAWHGLGTVVQDAPSTEDAIRLAGLDWGVTTHQLLLRDGTPVPQSKGRAIVRDSDGRILSVVGPKYEPLQNSAAFAWFDPFVQSGEATLETAGSLRNGERVWVLAKLGHNGDSHADIVPGDTIYNHILLANGHDGVMSIRVGRVRTRVVCANTLASALGERTSLRIKHTSGARQTMDDIREVMRAEHEAFTKDVESFRELASKHVTRDTLRAYVEAVFPESFKPAEAFKKGVRRPDGTIWRADRAPLSASLAETIRACGLQTSQDVAPGSFVSPVYDRIVELVETGRGSDMPGVRGSWWGAYNAVSEYLQYELGRGAAGFTDKRADSMMFGAANVANSMALQKAIEFSQGVAA